MPSARRVYAERCLPMHQAITEPGQTCCGSKHKGKGVEAHDPKTELSGGGFGCHLCLMWRNSATFSSNQQM
eukprot:203723-Prymnesium_polylepis.1